MSAAGETDRLRELPSVERLAAAVAAAERAAAERAEQAERAGETAGVAGPDGPGPGAGEEPTASAGALVTEVSRATIEGRRAQLRADPGDGAVDFGELVQGARAALHAARRPSLRGVVNATGVIVHTNLGRAPLAGVAREAVARIAAGYSNLELDLEHGGRGSRQAHVAGLLRDLVGAEDAIAVNNCAAAVLLAACALAGPGRAIVVSRGQLIEIGGSFRIPEVVAASGSRLLEVGTTNRTRLRDYARALERAESPVGAILRAHPSNFRTVGFVEEVDIEALCSLGVPVIDDVGSGVLADGLTLLADEPSVRRSVRAGADLICFSGDKLLGGPQAGLIVGRAEAVAAARAHPLARALRVDKLSLAALEATLGLYREPERALREIPVLAMLLAPPEVLAARARELADRLCAGGVGAEVTEATARVGGGALPLLELPGPVVALAGPAGEADTVAAALRAGDPAVLARVHERRVLLDPRTIAPEALSGTASAVLSALRK